MKKILTLSQVKNLTTEYASRYGNEIRSLLVERVTENGGHLASNLGIVEISLALVRVMDLPRDKVIYDTGHQSYVHKILTGRGEEFSTLRRYGGLSGFPRREESPFDPFSTGHSGTGISAAVSFAKAARLRGEESFSVCVIGDGSFTGGMVFEALNNISPEDRVIIILNDNKMSIGRSVGRVRSTLNKLRTPGYYRMKKEVEDVLGNIPFLGSGVAKAASRVKNVIKRQALPGGNLFEEMGLHYFGPADGNDLGKVETLLKEAKKRRGPSVIHLCTKKGKGYLPAEKDPSRYHGLSPKNEKKGEGKSFSKIFGEEILSLAEKDDKIVCISAAMTDGVGLSAFEKAFPERFFDTGIAEEHAMTFAAGLSAAGLRSVFAVYSTFYQRAVDQLLHDGALQKLPFVVCLDRAGFSGEDGATHHGLFDLPLTLPIPGVKIYAPISRAEMRRALERALEEKDSPSVIRYPKGEEDPVLLENFPCRDEIEKKDYPYQGKCDMMVVTFGRVTANVLAAAASFSEKGFGVRVIRFFTLKGFEEKALEEIFQGAEKILFVEEGIETGSFSHYLTSLLMEKGLLTNVKVRTLCVKEEFIPHGSQEELLIQTGLDRLGIEREMNDFAKT